MNKTRQLNLKDRITIQNYLEDENPALFEQCVEFLEFVLFALYPKEFYDDEYNITIVGFCTDICVISNTVILKAGYYSNSNIYVKS